MFVSQIYDEAAEILGTTDKNKVFRKLTQAVQILMESGHYFHTNQEVDVCTGWDGQTITLPRGIEVPLGVNVDGSPTYFRGRLFQYHVNKGGMYNPVDWAWDDRGFVSTVMDIRQPSQLVAVSEHSVDAGGQVRVIGTDANNRELRTQLADGTTIDGIFVPIHAQTDFPLGSIEPDGVTIQTRSVAISPLVNFVSSSSHQLQSGQSAVLSLGSGTMPNFIYAGNTYYIGVDDSQTIKLYQSSLDAKAGTNPIFLQSILNAGTVTLTDSRESNLLTAINLETVPVVSIGTPNPVAFSVGTGTGTWSTSLPSPLVQGVTYFAQPLNSTNLQVYSSIIDAQNGTNPVLLTAPNTGVVGKFNTDIRKEIAPQTTLSFASKHYYQTGDQVQAFTSGGTLPSPLIAGQNYFVFVIDDNTVSIHTTASDASTGANPIVITDNGSGTNSLVKLINATSTTGTINQIVAPDLKIPTPTATTTASAIAVVSGSITNVKITKGGSKYTDAPIVTFDSPLRTYSFTATTNGTTTLSAVSNLSFIVIGQTIEGAGIPSGTIVTGIGATTITISNAATTSLTLQSFTVRTTVPPNSQQVFSTATGYAVMVPDAVGSTTYAVGSIVITSAGQGYITAPNITIDPPTTNVAFTANSTLGSGTLTNIAAATVTALQIGANIYGDNIPDGTTLISKPSGTSILVSNVATSTVTAANYAGSSTTTANGAQATPVLETSFVSNITIPTGLGGSGYENPPIVEINGGGGTGARATAQISNGSVTTVSIVTQGTGYKTAPAIRFQPSTGVFVEFSSTGTLPQPITSGTPYRIETPLNSTTGTYTIKNADFSDVNVTGSPTGSFYVALTRPFSITFNSTWTGNFAGISNTPPQGFYFASDYLLPSGVNSTTQYFLKVLNNTTAEVYSSSANSSASPQTRTANTTIGSKTITNVTASTGLAIGQKVTGTNIPANTYIDSVSGSTVTLNNPATASGTGVSIAVTIGIVTATSLGVGQSYFSIRVPSYAKAYNNLVVPSSIEYLSNGEIVQFSSTGTLPLPLISGTNYKISLSGNNVSITDTSNNPIVFVNGGGIPTLAIGQMSLNIIRTFTPVASTSIDAIGSLFEIGDQITVRANVGDTLPNGLVESSLSTPQYYYVRPVDSGSFELYNTRSNAVNLVSTTGRITFYNTGNKVSSTFFVDAILPPTLIKSILHVEKPETLGYVSLYALDYGRSNDMALIGQYHPTETNPKYRRIRIGKKCAWARIIYRVAHPVITSQYDYIPLENERAIIAAVHACDLEDKDFIEQAQRYWATAVAYLKNQNESMEGHAMSVPQIQNIVYAEGNDCVMF
jgi:hypothetical protein